MHHKGPCCRLYTPLIYVSFKHRAIFTQQLTHLFYTHKHTNLATQRDKDKHTYTRTQRGKKRASNCFLFEARHHYTTMHHRQEVRMVGVFKTHENRQIVVHTSSIQAEGGGKGGVFFLFIFFLPWIESKGAELCERLGVLFTGNHPYHAAHCVPVQ